MEGVDSQKQLLTLIREFATEKSEGERRVIGLKRRVEELRSELDLANAETENAKCAKECAEQELRGCEAELKMSEALVQALEARISTYQGAISKVGSEVEDLKNEARINRDDFINQMFEFNRKIREFHETVASTFSGENTKGSSYVVDMVMGKQATDDMEAKLVELEAELECILSKTRKVEWEYHEEENIHNKVQQELFHLERQVSLMDDILKVMKELQELTSDLEATCLSLSGELQKQCACPSCHLDNVASLGGILQSELGLCAPP